MTLARAPRPCQPHSSEEKGEKKKERKKESKKERKKERNLLKNKKILKIKRNLKVIKEKRKKRASSQKTNPSMITSAKNYTKKTNKQKTDRQNPRTLGKSKAVQT